MTALTFDRVPKEIKGHLLTLDVAASVKIYAGALIAMDSDGNAKPATSAAGLIPIGVADEYVDNSSGSAGDVTVNVRKGIFSFKCSGIAVDDIGKLAYMVDDQTVSLSSNSGARSPAGRIVAMDGSDVFVAVGDVAAPGTSQGARLLAIPVRVVTLVGSNTYRAPCPVDGKVVKVYSSLGGALATGDATLTSKINTTAITDGALTITQSGSAAGDVDSATPSAANTVAAGDNLAVTVGGTNTNAVEAAVIFLVEVA